MKVLLTGVNPSQGLSPENSTSVQQILVELGAEIVKSVSEKPQVLICVDFKMPHLGQILKARLKGVPCALITYEPDVVYPLHGKSWVRKLFGRQVRLGHDHSSKHFGLEWPQTWRHVSDNQNRAPLCVLVNSDKWSFCRGSQYWLRAGVASLDAQVQVFGFGWDSHQVVRLLHRVHAFLTAIFSGELPQSQGIKFLLSRPRNYLGTVKSKQAEMEKYKVALVVENSAEVVTEKIFDALFAGCIPVYVGPVIESIPESLFFRAHPSVHSITESIRDAMLADGEEHRARVSAFLNQPGTVERWAAKPVLSRAVSIAMGA